MERPWLPKDHTPLAAARPTGSAAARVGPWSSPQVAANGLTGHLQNNHGGIQHTQRLDGGNVQGDDVTRIHAYGRDGRAPSQKGPGNTGTRRQPPWSGDLQVPPHPQETRVICRELSPPLPLHSLAFPPCKLGSVLKGPGTAPVPEGPHKTASKPTPSTGPRPGLPDPGPEGEWRVGLAPAAAPGWRSRVSRAALRDTRSCGLWSVLSKQYLRSSTAGRESGKSAGRGWSWHVHTWRARTVREGPRCAHRPTLNELKGRGAGRRLPGRRG